jgi:hypothetical protein
MQATAIPRANAPRRRATHARSNPQRRERCAPHGCESETGVGAEARTGNGGCDDVATPLFRTMLTCQMPSHEAITCYGTASGVCSRQPDRYAAALRRRRARCIAPTSRHQASLPTSAPAAGACTAACKACVRVPAVYRRNNACSEDANAARASHPQPRSC